VSVMTLSGAPAHCASAPAAVAAPALRYSLRRL